MCARVWVCGYVGVRARAQIVKLFQKLESLRKIVSALSSAVIPVSNAFFVLGVISSIYAIIGVQIFHDKDPVYFSSFSNALFTVRPLPLALAHARVPGRVLV